MGWGFKITASWPCIFFFKKLGVRNHHWLISFFERTSISIYIRIYIFILTYRQYLHMCIHTYIYIYVYIVIFKSMYKYIYIYNVFYQYVYIYLSIYLFIYLSYSFIHLFIYLYVCMYTYIYIYVDVWIFRPQLVDKGLKPWFCPGCCPQCPGHRSSPLPLLQVHSGVQQLDRTLFANSYPTEMWVVGEREHWAPSFKKRCQSSSYLPLIAS